VYLEKEIEKELKFSLPQNTEGRKNFLTFRIENDIKWKSNYILTKDSHIEEHNENQIFNVAK
jgi:hypothetical protein